MSEKGNPSLMISIDIRQNRIRIHKTVLQELGFPKYIQFLVNPDKKHIAIRGVDVSVPGDQTERIKPKEMMLDNCYEFKSKSLMKKLYELIGSPNPQFTYRFIGNGVSEYNMVVFPIKTMTPFEG